MIGPSCPHRVILGVRSSCREWLAMHEHNPPMAKDPRKMKNPERLAASK